MFERVLVHPPARSGSAMPFPFRYFWFICAAIMLVNVVMMRGRMRPLVERGTVTEQEVAGFLKGAAIFLVLPCIVLGIIGVAAGWTDPFCAGMLSFDGTARTAVSLVLLLMWGAALWWVWLGNGAELLGRVAPALSNHPRYDRRYPPRLVQAFVTGIVLVSAIGSAVMWRTMKLPLRPDGCVAVERLR